MYVDLCHMCLNRDLCNPVTPRGDAVVPRMEFLGSWADEVAFIHKKGLVE